jgi:rubrerythrin
MIAQPSLFGQMPEDNRNQAAKPPTERDGRLYCPSCKQLLNRHTPERCPQCRQLIDRRALR